MVVSLIVAVNKDYAIGNSKSNKLLYRLKDDLKNFRKLTMGNYVVMGRTTFDSLPQPLQGRTNVVLSRKVPPNHIDYGGFEVIYHNNLENVINQYKESGKQEKKMFIIGGAEIYAQAFPYVDEVYITHIDDRNHPEADVYFPKEELDLFKYEHHIDYYDVESDLNYTIYKLVRN